MAPKSSTKRAAKPWIILCEDDHFAKEQMVEILRDARFNVVTATNETAAFQVIQKYGKRAELAVVDVRLPKNDQFDDSDSEVGRRAGIRIARFIRDKFPKIRVIGASFYSDAETRDWFSEHCFAYIHKTWLMDRGDANLYGLRIVRNALRTAYQQKKPTSFIVHGHSTGALRELARFIHRGLGWQKPGILRDMPSGGRTVIEKFEEAARNVDVVFVLLTPDDKAAALSAPDDEKRRARQNVIFEMGYFFGKLQRSVGRVILLHHGDVELPSDIHGIVYIDISHGIAAATESIRREVRTIASWNRTNL